MIPPFEENRYLAPGVHRATLDEIELRFGKEPEICRVQFESLRWLVDLARRAGAERLVINGSFTTDTYEPTDVDCVLLMPDEVVVDPEIDEEFDVGFPFLQIEVVQGLEFSDLVDVVFASDRDMVLKGVVEVIL